MNSHWVTCAMSRVGPLGDSPLASMSVVTVGYSARTAARTSSVSCASVSVSARACGACGAAALSGAAAWTSPAARWSGSTPARPAWPWSSARAWASGRRRCARTTCRWCCWGAGLLWFGWFGFNAGSALGAASGAVAGMVAITPSCGSVDLLGALVIGLVAGVLCSYAVSWKFRLGYDDSLDVVGAHLVAGIAGTVLIGVFATSVMTGGPEGLLHGGGLGQLWRQAVAVLATGAYAFAMSYGLGKLIDRLMGFRAPAEHELSGLDLAEHGETAYDHGVIHQGTLTGSTVHSALAAHAVRDAHRNESTAP